MAGVQSLPHPGRWINVADQLRRRGFPPPTGPHTSFCYPPSFLKTFLAKNRDRKAPILVNYGAGRLNSSGNPIDWVGHVRGHWNISQPRAKTKPGNEPFYYWQPYGCDYHQYSTAELRKCLLAGEPWPGCAGSAFSEGLVPRTAATQIT